MWTRGLAKTRQLLYTWPVDTTVAPPRSSCWVNYSQLTPKTPSTSRTRKVARRFTTPRAEVTIWSSRSVAISHCHSVGLLATKSASELKVWRLLRRTNHLMNHLSPMLPVLLSRIWDSRTRTRTRTWKLVLEDPRGQGLSSRTTTLNVAMCHHVAAVWMTGSNQVGEIS